MKNSNTKTKLVARVMLVVLLLASAVNLAGCSAGTITQVEKGQYYARELNRFHGVSLMIVSETNKFSVDNVTLNVYIGLHKKEHSLLDWFTQDRNKLLTHTYDISEIPDIDKYKNHYYVIYAASSSDYNNIDNASENIFTFAYILKEISFEESLKDGAYNFTKLPFSSDYYYNYFEQITIPKECIISNDNGQWKYIDIGIVYVEKFEDGSYVRRSDVYQSGASFTCRVQKDGTVIIDMPIMK